MAKSTNTCNSILALIFNATAFADIAENDGSAPLTNLWVSLHTDTPGVGGSQQTNEATYGAYARKSIVRTNLGWTTPDAGSTDNVATLQFDECSGSTNIISHVAIGTDETGVGRVLYAGALSAPRTISTGIQAQFNARALVVTES